MSVSEKEPVGPQTAAVGAQDVGDNSSDKESPPPYLDSGDIDPAAERRLLWKLDLTIYPILYVVYMMSFLDRINISNARIQNLGDDIDLTGNKFNIALFVSSSLTSRSLTCALESRLPNPCLLTLVEP